jgi:hypothetical protein
MTIAADGLPRLQGAPRYSTRRDRFVFGIVDHAVFVALAVNPRLCTDMAEGSAKVSYGECSGLLSQQRDRIELEMQALIATGATSDLQRLDLWSGAEMAAAF